MTRQYIKDGKHKNIKNLSEYKRIVEKIDCSIQSYKWEKLNNPLTNDNLEDYMNIIKKNHKLFLDKYNLDIIDCKIKPV